MAAPALPRSWVWRARLRAAALRAGVAWAPVLLVLVGSRTVEAILVASGVGVVVLALLVVLGGPSPTEVAVAGALRTGELPAGSSLALVDTEATARLRSRWVRWAWAGGWATVGLGVVLIVVTGATAAKVAYWSVFSVTVLASSWAVTVSAREALRWRAGADERWAAWAAGDRADAG